LLGAIALGDRDAAGRTVTGTNRFPGLDLTHGETRVLSYLPTNLSAREIARELYVSVNTVKTLAFHPDLTMPTRP